MAWISILSIGFFVKMLLLFRRRGWPDDDVHMCVAVRGCHSGCVDVFIYGVLHFLNEDKENKQTNALIFSFAFYFIFFLFI